MAEYNVETSKHSTTAANVVDTINFNLAQTGLDLFNRSGTPDLYFTVNPSGGSAAPVPTVGGDDTAVMVAGSYRRIVYAWPVTQLKIISGTPSDYSVETVVS